MSIIFLFGAGSRYETPELAGASHLFEHMLFKGTPERPTPRDISEVVEGVGGTLNAFTDREVTGYWCRLAQPNYRDGIDLLSDMTLNSLFREEDIAKEKQLEKAGSVDMHGPAGNAVIFNISVLHTATVRPTQQQRKTRSEERRVGKECRSRWSPYH